jgi:hypothetical protein
MGSPKREARRVLPHHHRLLLIIVGGNGKRRRFAETEGMICDIGVYLTGTGQDRGCEGEQLEVVYFILDRIKVSRLFSPPKP